MGAGVGVATHDGHTGQREPLLGTHHVDDAIVGVHHTVVGQPKLSRIALEGLHLSPRYRVGYRLVLVVGGDVVVGHAVDLSGTEALQSPSAEAVESLRRGDLVTVESVDVQLGGAVGNLLYHVAVPNLVK